MEHPEDLEAESLREVIEKYLEEVFADITMESLEGYLKDFSEEYLE